MNFLIVLFNYLVYCQVNMIKDMLHKFRFVAKAMNMNMKMNLHKWSIGQNAKMIKMFHQILTCVMRYSLEKQL
jgi:hypothetical protein